MPIPAEIVDGEGGGRSAKVTEDQALLVTIQEPLPPRIGSTSRRTFLSGLLGTTGLDSGTTDHLTANGTLNVPYIAYIASNINYDINITKFLIYIEDATVTHATFGALTALTNGIDIVSMERSVDTYLIQKAKKFTDLIQQTLIERPYGNTTTSFELDSASASGADAQILPFDIQSIIPGGIRIGRGTLDRIELRVNDNLTGLDHFTIRILGYRTHL
jgi:hypothetical protein